MTCPAVRTTPADDDTIRIVTTEEYLGDESLRVRGIAAPCEGEPAVYLYHDSWDFDARLFALLPGAEEEIELERPAAGEQYDVAPGTILRLDAPLGLRIDYGLPPR